MIIDVVSNRRANLHNELVGLLDHPPEFLLPDVSEYAVSYQPIQRGDVAEINVWHEPLALGGRLPALPLPLDKGQCVRLNLEETYEKTCRRMRLPSE